MHIPANVRSIPDSMVHGSNPVQLNSLSSESIRGRDVIIINPYGQGDGDHALAKKIANIALEQGCRVTISSISNVSDSPHNRYQNYALQYDEPHTIDQLKNPLFIIAPLSVINIKRLEKHLNNLCDRFNLPRQDAILIEEMDILPFPNKDTNDYARMLREIGFDSVSENKLGFDEGSIGYIPTDDKTLNEVKARFKKDLRLLLDSYNVSLLADSSYHLGYISSQCFHTGTQLFITNTLCDIKDDLRPANFIISLRLVDADMMRPVVKSIKNILELGHKIIGVDYLLFFSKTTVTVIDDCSGKTIYCDEVIGKGSKTVNVILTRSIPKNIYDDFLLLASTGMMSGDQSLSEYLYLKGEMPYYDMQPWKYSLVKSIKKLYGNDLEDYIDKRVVGKDPWSGKYVSSFISSVKHPVLDASQLKKKNEMDKIISSKIASNYIAKLIRSRF